MEKHSEIMGIRIVFTFALIIFMSQCSKKEISSTQLCDGFYQLNKGHSMEGLFDVIIGSGRVMNVYDESANKYDLAFNSIAVFDALSNEYFVLPVFKRNASQDQKDSTFSKIPPESKSLLAEKLGAVPEELFVRYVQYVNSVYDRYYSIETPKSYSATNVPLEGNPSLGKFITFTLSDKVKVYYVADAGTVNDYWSKRFRTFKKLDTDWYCEISE